MKAGSRAGRQPCSRSEQAAVLPCSRSVQPEQIQPVARPPQLKIWGRVPKLYSLER